MQQLSIEFYSRESSVHCTLYTAVFSIERYHRGVRSFSLNKSSLLGFFFGLEVQEVQKSVKKCASQQN
jgi:hypothetical protein